MPYMNGEYYTKNSTSVQKRIDLINSIEASYGGHVPAWNNLTLEEVVKDVRRGLVPVGRKSRNSRHLRGGFYDPRKSPKAKPLGFMSGFKMTDEWVDRQVWSEAQRAARKATKTPWRRPAKHVG